MATTSPYNYEARTQVVCFTMKAENFHKDILNNAVDDFINLKDYSEIKLGNLRDYSKAK